MLFLGHFSFAYESRLASRRKEPWHGHFTAMAEARNVDAALEKFGALIHDLAEKNDLLDDVEEIYLDSCIEVTTIPRERLHRTGQSAGRRQPRRDLDDLAENGPEECRVVSPRTRGAGSGWLL